MQLIIVIAVIALAIAYAAYRLYLSIKHAGDPCYGCDGCALKDVKKKKKHSKKKECPKQQISCNK